MNRLLSAMILLAAGCGSGMLGESPVINGQIADWQGGGGYTVKAELIGPAGLQPVATGTVDEGGAFSLELPSSETVAPYLSIGTLNIALTCLDSHALSELGGMQEALLYLSVKKAETPEVRINLANAKDNAELMAGRIRGNYIYVDRDGGLTRRLECDLVKGKSTIDVDVKLSRGWNILIETITEYSTAPDGTRLSGTIRSSALPDEVKWQLRNASGPS